MWIMKESYLKAIGKGISETLTNNNFTDIDYNTASANYHYLTTCNQYNYFITACRKYIEVNELKKTSFEGLFKFFDKYHNLYWTQSI